MVVQEFKTHTLSSNTVKESQLRSVFYHQFKFLALFVAQAPFSPVFVCSLD